MSNEAATEEREPNASESGREGSLDPAQQTDARPASLPDPTALLPPSVVQPPREDFTDVTLQERGSRAKRVHAIGVILIALALSCASMFLIFLVRTLPYGVIERLVGDGGLTAGDLLALVAGVAGIVTLIIILFVTVHFNKLVERKIESSSQRARRKRESHICRERARLRESP